MSVILDIDKRLEVAEKRYLTATDIIERNFFDRARKEIVNAYTNFPQYRKSEHV